jgi:hypothetical protein
MALGILAKKITNAFKFHKEANGDMAKLKNDLINDGWKMTQDSTPVTQRMVTPTQLMYLQKNMLQMNGSTISSSGFFHSKKTLLGG